MRAAACLTTLLVGCASVLGIQDPSSPGDAGSDAGPGSDAPGGRDGGIDGGSETEHLVFNVGDFKLAQQQIAHLHVQLVHINGTSEDVTNRAAYASDNSAFVTAASHGVITGAAPGSAAITASLTGAMPATIRATVKATFCHPVINEFATAGTTGADEWVEIYNPCAGAIDVTGWALCYRAATNADPAAADNNLMVTLQGSMASGELRLFAGIGVDYTGTKDDTWPGPGGIMKFDVGAIALRVGPLCTGALKDSVAYGTIPDPMHPFIEGHPAPLMGAGVSASRQPFDGRDDDDGMLDFKVSSTARTPRALNAP